MNEEENTTAEAANRLEEIAGPTVVGIGASAGGLSALRRLFELIPADTGLVFVVVVHLSPEHKSMLADLLQPSVKFPVQQVTETTVLQPDNVYVIPPNCNLNSIDTHLRLSALEERRRERAPIDHFFRTLAATHNGHAIGVILTGTGSDGTLGLREIKAKGGVILVQDPNEAEFDGMPQSAITTGGVDRILPLNEIASTLVRLAHAGRVITPKEMEAEQAPQERLLLPKVLAILKARTDRDFSRYKPATILRRIARRMQLNYIEDFNEYLNMLRDRSDEAHALADDLLITVTSFFRDPEVFEKLQRDIIPRLFEGKSSNSSVRAWSVGCATGEEAYSIAMLLLEESSRRTDPPKLQVFASDLHKRSLEGAREGLYPGDIETDVSPERLQRFFRKENGGYRISKEVRDLVVFAPHNLLADPPFSRVDLISCRNLLIYIDRSVQSDVIDLFHYALCPHGYLLLGSAETIDALDLFRTEDKRLCIYEKRNVPAPEPRLPVFPLTRLRAFGQPATKPEPLAAAVPYQTLHLDLLERFAPPSVLIGPDNRVVHLSEHAGRYLVHPGGEITTSILRLVAEELRVELQALIHTARETKSPADSNPILVRLHGLPTPVVLHVRPAQELYQEGFLLVIFDERQPITAKEADSRVASAAVLASGAAGQRIAELEADLNVARQRLQATIEEYETSQEEMKSANEEMQSTNEELRSTLEELETSKEELQSINEELQTVNQENRHKVDELSQLSTDLTNLLAATDIATLFLDRELRILRFTPRLSEIFNIRITDRGRPISDLTHRLGHESLREEAQSVLDRLIPVEQEICDESDRWYLTRMLPYRSADDRIEGVVITFIDITGRKKAEQALRQSESRFRALVTTGSHPVFRMSPDWKLMYQLQGNDFLADTAEPIEDWAEKYILPEDLPTVRKAIDHAIQNKSMYALEHRIRSADGGVGWVFSRAVPILDAEGNLTEWFGAGTDVTASKEAEAELRAAEERHRIQLEEIVATRTRELQSSRDLLQAAMDSSRDMIQVFQAVRDAMGAVVDFRWLLNNYRSQQVFGDVIGKSLLQNNPGVVQEGIFDRFKRVVETGEPAHAEFNYVHEQIDGWFFQSAVKLGDGVATTTSDITIRKQAEQRLLQAQQELALQALRESEERFRLLVENVQEYALFQTDLQGHVTSWNPGAERLFGYSSAEILGRPADILFTPEDRNGGLLQAEIAQAVAGTHGVDARWVCRKDGETFWAQWATEPVLDATGQVRGVAKVLRDESDRKQYEERQALLMGELNHRVKNTLATVQSLANQTLRSTPEPAVFVEKFQERLWALSRAHTVLTRRSWESADIAEIVREQVYTGHYDENIAASGPAALLAPQTAVALSLVLHELTTNARKYGALSQSGGRLSVKWRLPEAAQALELEWAETGGPPVQSPDKRGFGSMLIERSLGGVGGTVQTRFEPGGLLCTIRLPLASSASVLS
ncbi:chemotaxis protein CheB [Terriglobus aquaticus]|uniref:histidine kinase n=1 Tax=Terriglobus aquaticus TaxID=940139 RepID=A0ABW9KQL1_9BACT|nr:chemotaxis protein CheB [Terriglobus aquaticus]